MDLIKEVLDSTKDFEPPRRFYYWSTLAAISAVLKDHVWFNMADHYNVYPAIYVLLYGKSGIRKGPPISLAEDLVRRVDTTRVIDGRSSIEGVIKELGTFKTRPGKEAFKDSCGFMVASELSSSIIGNNSAMDIMTEFYDRLYKDQKEWNYRLKVGESVVLKSPTITWLSGTNEALFKDFMPEKNLHGGLMGRIFVITESRRHTINSLMFKSVAPDKVKLTNILKHIAAMQGEFKASDDIRHGIDEWYKKFSADIEPKLADDTGFVSRVLDFIMKLSILIAAGRRQLPEILLEDVDEAMKNVLPLVVPTQRVVESVKKADASYITKRGLMLTLLANRPEFKEERTKILQTLGLQIDHEDLDKFIQEMFQRDALVQDTSGGTISYRLKMENTKVKDWIEKYRS